MAQYQEGKEVLVPEWLNDKGRASDRWCKATVIRRHYAENFMGHAPESYLIEFTDSTRGVFDVDHIRPDDVPREWLDAMGLSETWYHSLPSEND